MRDVKSLKLDPLQFQGMRHRVQSLLKKAIFDGLYEPGEQIYEAELAKKLNLSRGPIREALLQLERESLVRHVHNKGWYVLNLTPQELTEIASVRAVLEVIALRLARRSATKRQLARLRSIQKKMTDAIQKGNAVDENQADFDFHQEIWEMTGHRVLQGTLVRICTPYFAYFKMPKAAHYRDPAAIRKRVESDHQAIIDYLAGKTDKTAETCVRNLLEPAHFGKWSVLLDLSREKR